jgi:hypothetical protein
MSTDKIDPSKKDATISSADDLTKTTNKGDVELSEEELKARFGWSGPERRRQTDRISFA